MATLLQRQDHSQIQGQEQKRIVIGFLFVGQTKRTTKDWYPTMRIYRPRDQ
jgi:hypothetical protein